MVRLTSFVRWFAAITAVAVFSGAVAFFVFDDDQAANSCVAQVLKPGSLERSLTVNGVKREYLLHIPSGYQGQPIPVVHAYHGLTRTGQILMQNTDLAALADQETFAVVAPQGSGQPSRWDFLGEADLDFAEALVAETRKLICIDSSAQFALGHSNGSLFVFELACRRDVGFAAIGGVSAAYPPIGECSQQIPAFLYVHSVADEIVPFEGGMTVLGEIPSIAEAISAWAAERGCRNADISGTGQFALDDCGSTIHFLATGSHSWPMTEDFNASETMWEFFESTRVMP